MVFLVIGSDMTQTRKTDMPFASVFTAFPTLEVPFASVPSVFRASAIPRSPRGICNDFLPSGVAHMVIYGVSCVWQPFAEVQLRERANS